MKTTLLLFALFVSASVLGQKDKVDQITVDIEAHKHLSYGAFHKFLSLTCSDRGVEHIEDFEFEWGYNYKLKLQRTKLARPMEDAGDTDYKLIKVISKTPVPDSTTFKMRLEGFVQLSAIPEDDGAFTFNDGTCTYLGNFTFHYDPKFEATLKAIDKTEKSKVAYFIFLNGKIHLKSVS
jgi:hypothetical protein